jgi:hypothetical protein
MKPTAIGLLAAMLLLACLLGSANSQEDMEVVDNSAFEDPQRVSSIFEHDSHNEKAGIEECNECHHVYEDGQKLADESSEGQACGECHGPRAEDGMPGLRKAFHLNCRGCHLEKEKGPIMCGECHKR